MCCSQFISHPTSHDKNYLQSALFLKQTSRSLPKEFSCFHGHSMARNLDVKGTRGPFPGTGGLQHALEDPVCILPLSVDQRVEVFNGQGTGLRFE